MDFVKKLAGGNDHSSDVSHNNDNHSQNEPASEGGGFLSSLQGRMQHAAGGGRESEKDEDMLDKGVDFVQERIFKKGKQDNEGAVEQAKDEAISDSIRKAFKSTTGKEIPIKDKPTRFS